MQTIGQRIYKLRKDKKLARDVLGSKIGVSKTSIKNWEDDENVPKVEYLQALADFFNCSVEYLTDGFGDIHNVEAVNPKHLRKVPIINWVQAGNFTDIAPDVYDEFEYVVNADYGSNIYWLRIRGDSMTPAFNQGDLILVDMDRQPNAGNYVIARLEGEDQATFKRYKPCGLDETTGKEYFQLIALNDFYAPIDSRVQNFSVVGTVVEHKRSLV